VVGFLQAFLLNDSADYSRGVLFKRSILWLLLSGGVVLGAALLFGWLAGSPGWVLAAFTLFFMLTLMFALMGLKFEQDADTRRLNSDLKRFQARE
jgi:4-hydroxybenzoate polyprenyltransferase